VSSRWIGSGSKDHTGASEPLAAIRYMARLYSCTMYDADKGIRTGYCYDDMIPRPLRHTQQGVSKALQRVAEGRLGRDPRG
jgi:hypothetical protein